MATWMDSDRGNFNLDLRLCFYQYMDVRLSAFDVIMCKLIVYWVGILTWNNNFRVVKVGFNK